MTSDFEFDSFIIQNLWDNLVSSLNEKGKYTLTNCHELNSKIIYDLKYNVKGLLWKKNDGLHYCI